MNVASAVGKTLAGLGVRTVFGVVGSGNFHVTNALIAGGARFVAARHECGAATMADACARVGRTACALSVHQGPGLTNALTGITEAAKSRTPLIVLAAEATEPRSNFHIDQTALATAVGAVPERIRSAATAVDDAARAWRTAVRSRRTVVLNLPLDVQAAEAQAVRIPPGPAPEEPAAPVAPAPDVTALAELINAAKRPVFIAGRGARGARPELERLAEAGGALLATSAVAKGLFNGNPWYLDICGGFATPLAASLVRGADLIVGWGCSLNMWTTRHGGLVGPDATVAQVDDDPAAIGRHTRAGLGVEGDVRAVAEAATPLISARAGYRSEELRERIGGEGRWRDLPYDDTSGDGRIDPRTLSIALDDLLPSSRTLCIDSGNFMGYPSMYMSVPDDAGFCFTQAFQSIGLGLATAIGAAIARPDRLTVAALGDGGALMSAAELETAVRLRLPMVIVIYNDDAYGAEVHHFTGEPMETVTFPQVDIAAIARGYGCAGITARSRTDLEAVRDRLAEPLDRPLLIDAKVTADRPSWWLEEAFRGH